MYGKHKHNIPLVGERSPFFTAKAFGRVINFPDDYKGKWVVLLSLPIDFASTLVLESNTLFTILEEFETINTKLISLCIDSIYSYIRCLEIYKKMADAGIDNYAEALSIIEDVEKIIAKKFSMPQASEDFCHKPIETVFVIDPNAKIRCIINYANSRCENFMEIKHIVLGLQNADIERNRD